MKKQQLQCLPIALTINFHHNHLHQKVQMIVMKRLLFLVWLNSSFSAMNANNTCLLVGKLLLVTMCHPILVDNLFTK